MLASLRLLAVWYNAPNCSIASLKRGGTAWRIHGAKRSHHSCLSCSLRGFCPARRSTVRHGQAKPKVRQMLMLPRLRKLRRPLTPLKPPSRRSLQLRRKLQIQRNLRTQRSSPPPRNPQPRRCRSVTLSPRQVRIIQLLSPRMGSFGPGVVTRNFNSDIRRAMRKTLT